MADIFEATKEKLGEALASGDKAAAIAATQEGLSGGLDPLRILQEIVVPTMTMVGDKFQAFELFLPELMAAGEAAAAAGELLEKAIQGAGQERKSLGVVALGTVKGDIHDIGKNIVAAILRAHGFSVMDLGRDVSAETFLDAAEKVDIVGMSSLMTTTRPNQRSVIQLFKEVGIRDKVKIIVGGGCVTADWAEEIGADGYAADAAGAANLCKRLLEG